MIKVVVLILVCSLVFTASYTLTQADKDAFLNSHNSIRASYGLPPLVWSSTLETDSRLWAEGCNFVHSGAPNVGENLASKGSTSSTFPFVTMDVHVVGQWKAEETSWSCPSNGCSGVCGHLTQILWRDTNTVGCGIAQCPAGTLFSMPAQYAVCRYSPPGNYIGKHPLDPTVASVPSSSCPPTYPTANPTANPSTPTAPRMTPTAPKSTPTAPKTTPTAPKSTPTTPKAPSTPTTPKSTPTTPKSTPTTPKSTPTAPKSTPTAPKPTPTAPKAPVNPYYGCIADYWPNNQQTLVPCLARPWYDAGVLYCECGDPEGWSWSVTNAGSSACPSSLYSAISDGNAISDTDLSTGAWIGIAIGIAAFIIIVIVVVILLKKKQQERV